MAESKTNLDSVSIHFDQTKEKTCQAKETTVLGASNLSRKRRIRSLPQVGTGTSTP